MNYLHYEFDLEAGQAVEVELSGPANVRLLDDENFDLYRHGKLHRYHGGFAKESPAELVAPRSGHWHVVNDLGGYAGHVRARVEIAQETA